MLLSVPSEVLWASAQSLFVGSWDVGCCHPASDIDLGKNKGGSTVLRCLLLSAASGMFCDALGGQEGVGGGVGVGAGTGDWKINRRRKHCWLLSWRLGLEVGGH